MNIQYYEITFGKRVDNENNEEVCRGLYDMEHSIAIKATHYPTIEEAENFCKEDMETFDADGIYSITPVTEDEVYSFFDTENIDNWKVIGGNDNG